MATILLYISIASAMRLSIFQTSLKNERSQNRDVADSRLSPDLASSSHPKSTTSHHKTAEFDYYERRSLLRELQGPALDNLNWREFDGDDIDQGTFDDTPSPAIPEEDEISQAVFAHIPI